jgi:hypothetical protein
MTPGYVEMKAKEGLQQKQQGRKRPGKRRLTELQTYCNDVSSTSVTAKAELQVAEVMQATVPGSRAACIGKPATA